MPEREKACPVARRLLTRESSLLNGVAKFDLEVLLLPQSFEKVAIDTMELFAQHCGTLSRVPNLAVGQDARRVRAVPPARGRPPNAHERGAAKDEAEDERGHHENPRLGARC